MPWFIRHSIFGRLDYTEWEDTNAQSYDEAIEIALEKGYEEFESYGGLHGIPTVESIMEEQDLSLAEAEIQYNEEVDSWLSYEAEFFAENINPNEVM